MIKDAMKLMKMQEHSVNIGVLLLLHVLVKLNIVDVHRMLEIIDSK